MMKCVKCVVCCLCSDGHGRIRSDCKKCVIVCSCLMLPFVVLSIAAGVLVLTFPYWSMAIPANVVVHQGFVNSTMGCQDLAHMDGVLQRLVDSSCIDSGSVASLPCPRDTLIAFWDKFTGELRIDTLCMAMVAVLCYVSIMSMGGIPKPVWQVESNSNKLFSIVLTALWIALQASQVVCLCGSIVFASLAYKAVSVHFSPCLRQWQGFAPTIHIWSLPVCFWHPVFNLRFFFLGVSLESLHLSCSLVAPRVSVFVKRASFAFSLYWRFSLCLQAVVFCGSMAVLFSVVYLPISLAFVIVFLSVHCMFVSVLSRFSKDSSAWAMSITPQAFLSCASRILTCSHIDLGTWVYFGLGVAAASPTVCFGYAFAWDAYGAWPDSQEAVGIDAIYGFAFRALTGYSLQFPQLADIMNFDLDALLSILGDISKWLEYDPGDLLKASTTLAGLQMVLGIAKWTVSMSNMLITTVTHERFGLPTDAFARALKLSLSEGRSDPLEEYPGLAKDRFILIKLIEEDKVNIRQFERNPAYVDSEIMQAAIRRHGVGALEHAPESLLGDKSFMMKQLAEDAESTLKYATEILRSDPDFMRAACEKELKFLEHASQTLISDKEFMLEQFHKNVVAIRYANQDFVCAECSKDISVLGHASATLRSNKEFMLGQLRKDVDACNYATMTLRSDSDFMRAACKENIWALKYASATLLRDEEFMAEMCKVSPWTLQRSILLSEPGAQVQVGARCMGICCAAVGTVSVCVSCGAVPTICCASVGAASVCVACAKEQAHAYSSNPDGDHEFDPLQSHRHLEEEEDVDSTRARAVIHL